MLDRNASDQCDLRIFRTAASAARRLHRGKIRFSSQIFNLHINFAHAIHQALSTSR